MKMRLVIGDFACAAGIMAELKSRANHIMLKGLHSNWQQDDLLSIFLISEKAGKMMFDVPVDLNLIHSAHS